MNKKIIEKLSKAIKIPKKKLEEYFLENNLNTLFNTPESISPNTEQRKRIHLFNELQDTYQRITKYDSYKFDNPSDLAPLLSTFYSNKRYQREVFLIAALDDELKLLGVEPVSVGTLNRSLVHPREVFSEIFTYDARNVVISHNHPSGDPRPSMEDKKVNIRLVEAGRVLGINILDHIIIGSKDAYYSFKEDGIDFPEPFNKPTENNTHVELYKEDSESFVQLLSDFSKIPKTRLNKALASSSPKKIFAYPEAYFDNQKDVNKIKAIAEIRRAYLCDSKNPVFSSADIVKEFAIERYKDAEIAKIVFFLNSNNGVINNYKIPRDAKNHHLRIQLIMEKAIKYNSASIFLIDVDNEREKTRPDYKEISFTKDLKEASELFGIPLLDQVNVYSNSQAISYREEGIFEKVSDYDFTNRVWKNLSEKEKMIFVDNSIDTDIFIKKKDSDIGFLSNGKSMIMAEFSFDGDHLDIEDDSMFYPIDIEKKKKLKDYLLEDTDELDLDF